MKSVENIRKMNLSCVERMEQGSPNLPRKSTYDPERLQIIGVRDVREVSFDYSREDSSLRKSVFVNLLKSDRSSEFNLEQMRKCSDVSSKNRKDIVIWIQDVMSASNRGVDATFLAIKYFDIISAKMTIPNELLQLVASSCLFLASKMKEADYARVGEIMSFSANTYSKASIIQGEELVLEQLGWNMDLVTVVDFIEYFSFPNKSSSLVNFFDDEMRKFVITLAEILMRDPVFGYLCSAVQFMILLIIGERVRHFREKFANVKKTYLEAERNLDHRLVFAANCEELVKKILASQGIFEILNLFLSDADLVEDRVTKEFKRKMDSMLPSTSAMSTSVPPTQTLLSEPPLGLYNFIANMPLSATSNAFDIFNEQIPPQNFIDTNPSPNNRFSIDELLNTPYYLGMLAKSERPFGLAAQTSDYSNDQFKMNECYRLFEEELKKLFLNESSAINRPSTSAAFREENPLLHANAALNHFNLSLPFLPSDITDRVTNEHIISNIVNQCSSRDMSALTSDPLNNHLAAWGVEGISNDNTDLHDLRDRFPYAIDGGGCSWKQVDPSLM